MTVIRIADVKKFVGPLKAVMNSVNSVIFTKKETSFMVNTKSEDASQMANIWYKPEVISVESGEVTQFGIYNLSEFINVLTLFGDINTLVVNINNNVATIVYNNKSKIDYVLSDLTLIKEGSLGPKQAIPFLATFELDSAFIKKVKSISASIGVNILKIKSVGGALSYSISGKGTQAHNFTETISDSGTTSDFEVSVTIKDEKRDNFGILFDGPKYNVSVHSKIIQFEAVTEEYEKLRYFISPLLAETK